MGNLGDAESSVRSTREVLEYNALFYAKVFSNVTIFEGQEAETCENRTSKDAKGRIQEKIKESPRTDFTKKGISFSEEG